jgi:hypothetical protein
MGSNQNMPKFALMRIEEHPKIKSGLNDIAKAFWVFLNGFEPLLTESESGVLPLHYRKIAVLFNAAKVKKMTDVYNIKL